VAFGADGAPQTCDALEALALTQFVGRRARLEWRPTVQVFTGPASQALLILAQVAAGALPTGGAARVTAEHGRGETIIVVESQGAPATVFPEVLEGLAGKPLTSGFAGRWAPARYMRAIIDAAGGRVRWNIDPERLVLEVALPD
jgi:histidine phosphotransferase ChpT